MRRRRGSSITGRGRRRVAIGARSVVAAFSACALMLAVPGYQAVAGTTSSKPAHIGRGGCQPSTDPTSLSFSGTVTSGLDLGVDVDGTASADDKGSTKSFSGGFDV